MSAVSTWGGFRAQVNKVCYCFHFSPFYLPWIDGTICLIFVCRVLRLKPAFSLSMFTLIKSLFNLSSFSATRVVSSAHLRLFTSLLAVLIPTCDSSSLAFHMRYYAKKWRRVTIHTLVIPFSQFCSMSGSSGCFLTHIQVFQEASKVV